MKVLTHIQSPNFGAEQIPAEYIVLHYTACHLERALATFTNPVSKKTAHFVIAPDGSIYDLGNALTGPLMRGAHAGESFLGELNAFNGFSVGIEIVNLNGNLIPYTDPQYTALAGLVKALRARYPVLNDPARAIGHEHIAGHRGKVDPGILFDWKRFFETSYDKGPFPKRTPLCTQEEADRLKELVKNASPLETADPKFWSKLSHDLEMKFKKQ